MKIPSLKSRQVKLLQEQSDPEKMYLLKLAAHQFLGQKWIYYKKIKSAGKSGKLLKEKSLFKEMKATQSALKFTSKNAIRMYILAYQNCVNEIKKFAVTEEVFPELPDETDDTVIKSMIPELDAVTIGWTPLKFLLPTKQLREKGTASERHTEGLITKLFFKVAGFYSVPENWDPRKLSFYMDRIDKDSSYPDVAQKLEPLKKDLLTFSAEFEQFKFGQAVLSKDTTDDTDAFDDAMEIESFDGQLQTLYWHSFIYKAIESFVLKYYLTLVSSAVSVHAIHYLTSIFEPALTHVIDMSVLFDGSFDTEISKKKFRKPFVELQDKKDGETLIKKIKTRQGIFEVYNYNLPLISKFGVPFDIGKDFSKTSFWRQFTETCILNKNRFDLETELSFTPYKKLTKSIADTEKQSDNLAEAKVKQAVHLADSKAGILSLEQEIYTLDNSYNKGKPDEIKEKLTQKRNQIEKSNQDTENQKTKLIEAKSVVVDTEKQLAQERDKLVEEEKKLNQEKADLKEVIGYIEIDLKESNDEKKVLETEEQGENAIAVQDLQQKIKDTSANLEDAGNKLKANSEKLTAIASERNDKILKGFERSQAEQTELIKKLNALDLELLNQKKQKKQINAEEIAFEEMISRYKDSRKKITDALKNAEKNLQKDVKTSDDIETKVSTISAEKADFQAKQQKLLLGTKQKLESLASLEARASILMNVLTLLITSSQTRKEAWQKVLEGFKQRLKADLNLAQNRVEEIKKVSQKKMREMGKKASKLKHLKQDEAAKEYQEEIDRYQSGIEAKCEQILIYARQEAALQKQQIIKMFHRISKKKKENDALPARRVFDLISEMSDGNKFKTDFLNHLIQNISQNYQKSLQPLYCNTFAVLRPTLLNKVSLIQALNKNKDTTGIQLSLSQDEHKSFNSIIIGIKNKLRKLEPDIFDYTVQILSENVTIDMLLDSKMDNPSLKRILSMKFSSPKNPTTAQLNPSLNQKILELNHIITPVPKSDLSLEGKENQKDPLSAVNTSLLKKLITEIKQNHKKEKLEAS